MSRIIAGIAGGRRLRVPPTGTRPTSDRVRESLFGMLAARVDLAGSRVLDLYAGSGALGLEAASRGASSVVLVENNPRAVDVIRHNIAAVGHPHVVVRPMNVTAFVAGPADEPFDLILLDPPYELPDETVAAVLSELDAQKWVRSGALVVVERDRRSEPTTWPSGWEAVASRTYGDTRVELARP